MNLLAQGAKTTRLELRNIDEPDDVHTDVIEAVIALVIGGLTESVEIFGDGGIGGVVLARHCAHFRGAQTSEQLLRQIEFGGLRQMRDIARMDDGRGLIDYAVHYVESVPALS